MRQTLRLFAAVKPVARYLEAGAPTGLTGVTANPSPRATLLYLYNSTLEKLQAVPETSVYRQSVEAVTKHRMAAVESVKPEGFAEWAKRAHELLKKHPEHFSAASRPTEDGSLTSGVNSNGQFFVIKASKPEVDVRYREWDGADAEDDSRTLEGVRTVEEKRSKRRVEDSSKGEGVEWVDEPQLTIAQIEELETKIGAGLIEEVIQVAEGELKLVDTMIQGKVWESLDEKPAEGQWAYFERKS